MLLLALLAVSQTEVGPLDAYRANYASIQAEVTFTFDWRAGDYSEVSTKRDRFEKNLIFSPDPVFTATGRWGCDGISEHYVVRTISDHISHTRNRSGGETNGPVRSCEVLFDHEIFAYHELNGRQQSIRALSAGTTPVPLVGPLAWWEASPFPGIIQQELSTAKVSRRKAFRGPYLTEVEVYRVPFEGGWYQVDISYDPSVGYLPRYVRAVSKNADGRANGKEFYLLDAKACAAGGFVPTEWYETSFSIKEFSAMYPDYTENTVLVPTEPVTMGHFKVGTFKNLRFKPALDQLENVSMIGGANGAVFLKGDKRPQSLTVEDLKSMLGRRFAEPPSPNLPDIDEVETREFQGQKKDMRWLYALGFLVATGFATAVYRRRRSMLGIFLGIVLVAGCQRFEQPRIGLTASFTQKAFIYDSYNDIISSSILIRNDGNQALRLFDVNGGCSCRKVDKSQLPTTIRPRGVLSLPISFIDKGQYGRQQVQFTISTDHGTLAAFADLYAIPRHHLSPPGITINATSGVEDEPVSFVHRAVFPTSSPRIMTRLQVPDEIVVTRVGTHTGRIADQPGFSYEDTTYEMRLRDSDLGLHKAIMILKDQDGRSLRELPVVWNRRPYLSPSPERIALGPRPARIFLRCPDDEVELTKILSAPRGIKAVVSSTNEVTVGLTEDAPEIIEGTVEVGTTARERPPLRIPVVRYAPPS